MMHFGNSDHSSLTLRLYTLDGTARGRGCEVWARFGSIQALGCRVSDSGRPRIQSSELCISHYGVRGAGTKAKLLGLALAHST